MDDAISASELERAIEKLLPRGTDLESLKISDVIASLSDQFGVEMKPRKKEIKGLIRVWLEKMAADENGEDSDGSEEEEEDSEIDVKDNVEEEKPRKKAKAPKTTQKKKRRPKVEMEAQTVEIPSAAVSSSGYLRRGAAILADQKSRKQASGDGYKAVAPKKVNKNGKPSRPSGFSKPCKLSPELAKIVGTDMLSRGQVQKKLSEYINANNLKDPANRQKIICDGPLESLLGVKRLDNFFSMTKYLKTHIFNVDADGNIKPTKPKTESGSAAKSGAKGKGNGLTREMKLSDKMADFMDARTMSRAQVVKNICKYIKDKDLQNPANRKEILLDEQLQSLFGKKKTNYFEMQKLLSPHFIKDTE